MIDMIDIYVFKTEFLIIYIRVVNILSYPSYNSKGLRYITSKKCEALE